MQKNLYHQHPNYVVLSRHKTESEYQLRCENRKEATMAAAAMATQWDFSCDFEVDFESEENASIIYAALAVDKELQPDKVKREMSVADGKLLVHFEAVEARFLRASFSAFVDVLTLATKTIEEFGGGLKL